MTIGTTLEATQFGIQDVPVDHDRADHLGLAKYARALETFIRQCKTPMSIGIQGDWGLGKTSLMNLIRLRLQDKGVSTYWINTWQLSQFDLGAQLPMTVMRNLGDTVGEGTEERRKFRGLLASAGKFVVKAALARGGIPIPEADSSPGDEDPGKILKELKESFQAMCAEKCSNPGDRIVVFIDDLDRLIPGKAVELMEVMKTFLDVPNAVFVLAIDYQVVVKGLEKKFGVGVDDLGGRSFFDKIIQVPFRMPSQAHEVGEYLARILQSIEFEIDGDIDDYVELLRNSLGFNPRSIKRLCNNLLLLRLVIEDGDDPNREVARDAHKGKLLFATLCMEWAHKSLYDYLSSDVTEERLQTLGLPKKMDDLVSEGVFGEPERVSKTLVPFARALHAVLDRDSDKSIDDAERNAFEQVLSVSAITSLSQSSHAGERAFLSSHARSFLRNQASADVTEALENLLEYARRSPDQYTISRAKDGYLTARAGSEQFWLVVPSEASTEIQLIFNCAKEDLVEGTSKVCEDVFRALGWDPAKHEKELGEDWAGYLHVTFTPGTQEQGLANTLTQWWCTGYRDEV